MMSFRMFSLSPADIAKLKWIRLALLFATMFAIHGANVQAGVLPEDHAEAVGGDGETDYRIAIGGVPAKAFCG